MSTHDLLSYSSGSIPILSWWLPFWSVSYPAHMIICSLCFLTFLVLKISICSVKYSFMVDIHCLKEIQLVLLLILHFYFTVVRQESRFSISECASSNWSLSLSFSSYFFPVKLWDCFIFQPLSCGPLCPYNSSVLFMCTDFCFLCLPIYHILLNSECKCHLHLLAESLMPLILRLSSLPFERWWYFGLAAMDHAMWFQYFW